MSWQNTSVGSLRKWIENEKLDMPRTRSLAKLNSWDHQSYWVLRHNRLLSWRPDSSLVITEIMIDKSNSYLYFFWIGSFCKLNQLLEKCLSSLNQEIEKCFRSVYTQSDSMRQTRWWLDWNAWDDAMKLIFVDVPLYYS